MTMRNDLQMGWNEQNDQPPTQIYDEFSMLMSLALDDLLDEEEQHLFDGYLAAYPSLANEWFEWQALDAQLVATPSVAPPPDFLINFENRLAQRQRRRHIWVGIGFGAVAMTLWIAAALAATSLGAFILLGQPSWLTQLIHNLAYVYASVNNGMATLSATAGAVAGTTEARTFGLIYIVVSMALVVGWIFFLRHSTRSRAPARAA